MNLKLHKIIFGAKQRTTTPINWAMVGRVAWDTLVASIDNVRRSANDAQQAIV